VTELEVKQGFRKDSVPKQWLRNERKWELLLRSFVKLRMTARWDEKLIDFFFFFFFFFLKIYVFPLRRGNCKGVKKDKF